LPISYRLSRSVLYPSSPCGINKALKERCMQGFVGTPEGKRPLERPRCRWEDNIKMHLQEMEWGAWTGLIWLRVGTGGRLLRMW